MPVPIAIQIWQNGLQSVPYIDQVIAVAKYTPWLVLLWVLKVYFQGYATKAERNMHSKVVMITGGTSGVGAQVARELATRGAQIILLTQHPLSDQFLVDYILDLREATNNDLITAEQVELSSLHSIRLFATKWVDNAPPRRLDMLVLCANAMTPPGAPIQVSEDGVESNFAINYLANFQLLSILSPAIRAQPPDRDVRILFGTCASYMGGKIPEAIPRPPAAPSAKSPIKTAKQRLKLKATSPSAAYACSKLALMVFASAFQKHLSNYVRPDKQPMNAKVLMVDPGWSRTPGMRRYLTRGSLWGLLLYLLTWPMWWLLLKSADMGAQSFLHAAMEAELQQGEDALLVKECKEVKIYRDEVSDEQVQKKLWETSEKAVELLEKEGAVRRAAKKKESEASEYATATAAAAAKDTVKAEKSSRAGPSSNGAADSGERERKAGSRRSRKAA